MTDRLSDTDLAATPEQLARAAAERDLSPHYSDGRPKMHRHFASHEVHADEGCRQVSGRRRVCLFDTEDLEAHETHIARRWLAEVEALRADNERKTQALVRAMAREAELVALLDPDNDETVDLAYAAVRKTYPNGSWTYEMAARNVLAALRAAANGEG